jgi:hypothetical protein
LAGEALLAISVCHTKLAHDDGQQIHASEGETLLGGLKLTAWNRHVKLRIVGCR